MRRHPWLLALLAATLACSSLVPISSPTPATAAASQTLRVSTATPSQTLRVSETLRVFTPTHSQTPKVSQTLRVSTPTPSPTPTAGTPLKGVPGTPDGAPAVARSCDFVPGVSVPAQMPVSVLIEGTPTPNPSPTPPANTQVDPSVNASHLQVFNALISTIQQDYVYTDVVKNQLPALQSRYQPLVSGGLTDDDFYLAMDDLITDLGDNHSYFESPSEAKATDAGFAGDNDFVGIGIFAQAVPQAGRAVIVVVFPGGPAAGAGLRSHDSIVAIDGQPALDPAGNIRDTIRGPAGSTVSLAIQRLGQPQFVVTLQRRRVTGALPIDYCLIASKHIGYIYLPGLDDETLTDQVRAALRALTVTGPMTGLVIDNRENGGGISTVLDSLLGLFTHGDLGRFVARDETRDLNVKAEDVGGSQSVPLLVLVSRDTVSYGEVLSGVLQISGRAKVGGQASLGNVETEWAYSFKDGSRVWLAHELFQPPGLWPGFWEGRGIVPDIPLTVRWDLFTEGTDPALAAAVSLFSK
jgi:C-terminal peptidase prc